MATEGNELEQLHRRVAELEETLRAIQAGELDVLIGPGEARRYASETADRLYRVMVEEMQDGAVILDSDTHTILWCNRAFADLVEKPQSQVLGRSVYEFLAPASQEAWASLLHDDALRRADLDMQRSSGRAFPASVSATRMPGDVTTWGATVIDLTDRKDVERLRDIQAELELINRRKDEFIAMLGHELRNPLAPIRHATEMLDEQTDVPPVVDRVREVLERQVEQMSRLIDDLLDAGRITRGTLAVHRRPMDFREAVRAGIEAVSRLVDRRGHRLRAELPPQPVPVRADSVRLTQVISNLLANAAKYTQDGGEIRVCLDVFDDRASLSVTDNGVGIPQPLLPHIFEPFVQAGATLDRRAGGLGVGLALVRRITELHDGAVSADSQGSGRGATFTVELPLTQNMPESEPPPEEPGERRPERLCILVVDDNEDAAEMLALVLQRRGHDVEVLLDGPSALQRLREQLPHLMFVDIGMPGMSGYELAEAIREEYQPSPALVAVTGYGGRADRARALDAGFDEHVVKPVKPDRLEQLIDRYGRPGLRE